MKLGVFTTFCPEYTFPEACRLAKALGYQGVQPRIVPAEAAVFDPAKPFNPWSNNKGGIAEGAFFADPVGVLKPAQDAGLEITSLASYTSTADMKRALAMVQACAKAGVKQVRIAALPMPKEEVFDIHAFLRRSRATYVELIGEAKKVGVRPCIELHMGTPYPNAAGIISFFKDLPPEDVGVLYDPGNMIYEGWEEPAVGLNLLGTYLAEVHVKNTKWAPDGADPRGLRAWKPSAAHLEDGCVNWAQIIEKLKLHGYNGWLVEEGHAPDRDTYTRLKMAFEFLSRCLKG